MEKKHALLLAFLITLVILGNWLFFHDFAFSPDRESVVIARVIDGDTVELEDGRTIRLLNINTPEKGLPFSDAGTDFLKDFLDTQIEMESAGIEKYGRTLGRLYSEGYLNLELVRLGYAHAFLVDESELNDFKRAEKEAIDNSRGIWQKSELYGCLEVNINKEDEFVTIEDDCSISFVGWTLKDESARSYKLDKVKTHNFRVYSAKGQDGEAEFYWGRGNVWNDDKDSIFIRDSKGLLAYYDSYGY